MASASTVAALVALSAGAGAELLTAWPLANPVLDQLFISGRGNAMHILLNTPFKGDRHYVHGTDIFNQIESQIAQSTAYAGAYVTELAFHRIAYRVCELVLEEDIHPDRVAAKGVVTLAGGGHKNFSVVETAEAPASRVPYDEDGLVARAQYSANSGSLSTPTGYTTIEATVALTKALSYRINPPRSGKWLFGSLQLTKRLPQINGSLEIRQTAGLPGRYSRNDIVIDGEPVGRIQFIIGNP